MIQNAGSLVAIVVSVGIGLWLIHAAVYRVNRRNYFALYTLPSGRERVVACFEYSSDAAVFMAGLDDYRCLHMRIIDKEGSPAIIEGVPILV